MYIYIYIYSFKIISNNLCLRFVRTPFIFNGIKALSFDFPMLEVCKPFL